MTCLSVQALWIPDAAVEPVVLREDAEWQPVNQHSGRGTFNLKRETTARELAGWQAIPTLLYLHINVHLHLH